MIRSHRALHFLAATLLIAAPLSAQRTMTAPSIAASACSVQQHDGVTHIIGIPVRTGVPSGNVSFTVDAGQPAVVPRVSWHAINTTGTGTAGRSAAPTEWCDALPGSTNLTPQQAGNSASFTVVKTQSTTRTAAPRNACSFAADPSVAGRMLVSVSLQTLTTGTQQEGEIIADAGPGGGPRVLARGASPVQCTSSDGRMAAVSVLLFPAVQK
jgi:hypothetical protein